MWCDGAAAGRTDGHVHHAVEIAPKKLHHEDKPLRPRQQELPPAVAARSRRAGAQRHHPVCVALGVMVPQEDDDDKQEGGRTWAAPPPSSSPPRRCEVFPSPARRPRERPCLVSGCVHNSGHRSVPTPAWMRRRFCAAAGARDDCARVTGASHRVAGALWVEHEPQRLGAHADERLCPLDDPRLVHLMRDGVEVRTGALLLGNPPLCLPIAQPRVEHQLGGISRGEHSD